MILKNWLFKLIRKPKSVFFTLFKRFIELLMPLFGLSVKPFYNKSDFEWLIILENNFEQIKEELINVYQKNLIPAVQDINNNVSSHTNDNKWKTFIFWVYGNRINKNCELCPKTESVIKQIPNFYTAFFSILEPGKNIIKHRGVYRGNTLAHLGLVVPEPFTDCTFHVKDKTIHWEEGKAFAFEDSYYHYVTNNAHTFRAVLIVEFRREIPKILKPFDDLIQSKIRNSYITKNIIENLN